MRVDASPDICPAAGDVMETTGSNWSDLTEPQCHEPGVEMAPIPAINPCPRRLQHEHENYWLRLCIEFALQMLLEGLGLTNPH